MTSQDKSPRVTKLSPATGLCTKVWIFPGRQGPSQGGVCYHDFIDDEYDLMRFAVNSINWIGDDEYLVEKARRDGGRRHMRSQHTLPPHAAPKRKKVVRERLRADVVPAKVGRVRAKVGRVFIRAQDKWIWGSRLQSCERALEEPHKNHNIFGVGNESKFQTQVTAIDEFFRGTNKAILYICGSPGVGKTSAIHWCCDKAEKAVQDGEFVGVDDILIGQVTAVTGDVKFTLMEIARVLGMGCIKMTMENHKGVIQNLTQKRDLVILVIDKVDKMASTHGRSERFMLWQSLCALAKDSDGKFLLVGISNAVNNAVAKKLTKSRKCDLSHLVKIVFALYTKDDLVNLAVARIGSSIVEPKALSLLATKVSGESGDAQAMLDLVVSAVRIRQKSCTPTQLKEEFRDDHPIVTIEDARKAVNATNTDLCLTIDELPAMAKHVLLVAVTICSNSSANFAMNKLKNSCNEVMLRENLEPIEYEAFIQSIEQLFDQGLFIPNCDDIRSCSILEIALMPVRFGSQLVDVHAAMAHILEDKPMYKKFADAVVRKGKASANAAVVPVTRAGCSDIPVDKETPKGDDAKGLAERGANFSVSPTTADGPEEVSAHERSSRNTALFGTSDSQNGYGVQQTNTSHDSNKNRSPQETIHTDQAVCCNFLNDDGCNPEGGSCTNVITPTSPPRHATNEKKGTTLNAKKPSSPRHAFQAKAKTSLSRDAVQAKAKTLLSQDAVQAEHETLLSRHAALAEDETSLSGHAAQAQDETSLSRDAVQANDETSLSRHAAQAQDETSLSRDAVQANDETSLSRHAAQAQDKTSLSRRAAQAERERIVICPRVKRTYYLIAKATGQLGGNGSFAAIYGELTAGSMQKLVNVMKEHTNFGALSMFIDVGSGVGKPNLHVSQDPGVQFSYGIEMELSCYWLSLVLGLNKVLKEGQANSRLGYKCMFEHGNIHSAESFDPFTHVYMFSIGYVVMLMLLSWLIVGMLLLNGRFSLAGQFPSLPLEALGKNVQCQPVSVLDLLPR